MAQTRIVVDGPGIAGRAALADASLRIGTAPGRSALLTDGGDALVVAAQAPDPAAARRDVQAVADAVLNAAPVLPGPVPMPVQAAPPAQQPAPAERARLLAAADAVEARAASVSAALTGLARDLAASARVAADRQPGRETLDKAATALAELQLQRIQLQSRYQDDYPAVVAVDGQIRAMRAFLLDETRRVDAARSPANNAGDATLSAERDRLRAELAQLAERRTAIAADLAALARVPAASAALTPATLPDTAIRAAAPPGPVLLEGAITVDTLPDSRWIALPLGVGAGLCLTLLGWFWPRRLSAAATNEAALRQLALAIQAHPAALPAPGYRLLPGGFGPPLPERVVLRQTR